MRHSKEAILEEIKGVARSLGQTSLTYKDFSKASSVSKSVVRYHFGGWNEAVAAAGLEPVDTLERARTAKTIADDELLDDLLRLHQVHGDVTERLINQEGKYSTRPYVTRWRTLQNALTAALELKHRGIKPCTANSQELTADIPEATVLPKRPRPRKRVYYGEPIDFRGLRFGPINEQGVVYLFGMISHELGFLIESIRTEYPDCEGKRRCDSRANLWEHIRIEFEYKSSNFVDHLHDDAECDLIVCWIHDWADSPIEVLELREAIKRLPRSLG